MVNNQFIAPHPDEIEISLFGPGFGESIVIHLGDGKWILVDSCIEPTSGNSAPLVYLPKLGVKIDEAVKLIVATHWHDDHVRGISNLFQKCSSAKFVISTALQENEFLSLIHLFGRSSLIPRSGLYEFIKIFKILQEQKDKGVSLNPPKLASADKLLYRDDLSVDASTVEIRVYSLSPSDAAVFQSILAFRELIPSEFEYQKGISPPSPNHASVVLWIEAGNHRVLLGADLEKTNDPKSGWTVILNEANISGLAGVYKVAHHGAESAHEPRIWSEKLLGEPIAILSPFIRGNQRLPTPSDVHCISSYTPNAYITSPVSQKRMKFTRKVVRESVQDVAKELYEINDGWGHIRLRRHLLNLDQDWQIELFGGAQLLRI